MLMLLSESRDYCVLGFLFYDGQPLSVKKPFATDHHGHIVDIAYERMTSDKSHDIL